MQLNKNQKILTIVYACCLLAILFLITPALRYNEYGQAETAYGSVFAIAEQRIYFKKLFIEIGTLTVIYILLLLVLKTPSKQSNSI